jgi:hypothetical protein
MDAAAARANLQRCRRLVGASFGLLDPVAAPQPETITVLPETLPVLAEPESQPA